MVNQAVLELRPHIGKSDDLVRRYGYNRHSDDEPMSERVFLAEFGMKLVVDKRALWRKGCDNCPWIWGLGSMYVRKRSWMTDDQPHGRTMAWIACTLVIVVLQAPVAEAAVPPRVQESPLLPGVPEPLLPSSMAAKLLQRSAGNDDWQTEVFNGAASAQLKILGKLISREGLIAASELSSVVAPGIVSSSLRPQPLELVFEDSTFSVYRGPPLADDIEKQSLYTGRSEFNKAFQAFRAPFAGTSKFHAKFKVIHVSVEQDSATTTVLYQAGGVTPRGVVQQGATWKCKWQIRGTEPPLLTRLDVTDFEEVTRRGDVGTLFDDCTEAVLGKNPSFHKQLLPSQNHWRARLATAMGVNVFGHNGLAIGDVNGDGLDDLFVCQPGGLPNQLFLQQTDGTVLDVSSDAGVDYLDQTTSALLLDFDNDGDQDLITAGGAILMFENDGNARFHLKASIDMPLVQSLSAADFDGNGWLDLYVCRYSAPDRRDSAPLPYHDANNGPSNVLLRNQNGWPVEDWTLQSGLDHNNRRFSFSSSWEDFDNDGDLDLYVANDFGRNNLYRNDGGRFVDVAAEAGVEDISAGMSVSWADYNRDGEMDLYVSNMFSSAGNRVTYQKQFMPGRDSTMKTQMRRHARGNTLFENMGDGTFRDVSVEAGVTMGRWAWSSNFLDYNNDSFEDLFIANGFLTGESKDDL